MQPYAYGDLALVLDCQDLDRAADFWCEVLGYRRAGGVAQAYLSLVPRSGSGAELLLQRVPEGKSGKNRLHLDLRTRDLARELTRVLGLGAALLTREPIEEDGWRWHVLADPDGNELCVVQPPAGHWPEPPPTSDVNTERRPDARSASAEDDTGGPSSL